MLPGLLIMLLVGFGCAGPQLAQIPDIAESEEDTCPSHLAPPEKDHATQKRCPSASSRWGIAGEALSGVATAVRMPNL